MSYRIDSATGALKEVLLCRPEHYKWLATSHAARTSLAAGIPFSRDQALEQHATLVSVLQSSGVSCHFLEPESNLPDLCWTRDSSQITPWGPVITCLSERERRGENDVLRAHYERHSMSVWRDITQGNIEGGDILIIRPGLLAIGHSQSRTSKAAATEFAGWFEEQGWVVRLQPVEEVFVHLDVTFCMAATGLAIVCKEVAGDLSDWLEENDIQVISVSPEETARLACNCLALGDDRVVMAGQDLGIAMQLRAEGIEVIELDLDMFTLAGGGVHCLTQPLRRDPL